MRLARIAAHILALLLVIWLAGACDDSTTSAPDTNVPPVTTISGGPIPFDQSSYLVDLKWFGEDVDGSVEGFEYAWDDTTNWFETVLTGSTFVMTSDTCCIYDTLTANSGADSVVERFFRYHTFFVRSVDNRGDVDPTPAHLTFNSTTVAPSTRITKGPPQDQASGRAVSIHWEGFDPDSPNNSVAAYEYFHATKGELRSNYGFVDVLGVTKAVWNRLDWIRVDADTTSVIIRGLATGYGDQGGNRHLFFVRSIDDAGAVEQLPVKGINWREWGATPQPSGTMIIRSNVMGIAGSNLDHTGQIFEGTSIVFSWSANLAIYDGVVTGYSHAYDNLLWSPWDLDDDRYPPQGDFTPVRGRHSFFARARDEAGLILQAEFPFEVFAGPRNLDTTEVFMIGDFHVEASDLFYPSPEKYRRFWTDSLLINFENSYFDPREENETDPPIRNMSKATTIILSTDDWEGERNPTVALWHQLNTNPLWSYVDAGGNLLVLGFFPSWNFLPDNDYLFNDTMAVPEPDPCFWWSTPKSCGSSLIWYQPILADSFPHPLYEYCGTETTYLDESADFLWGAPALLAGLPDLHVDETRSANFRNNGLWNCEHIAYRDDRGVIPIYGFSRTKAPLAADVRPVGIWIPSDGLRGHVVYLGMPTYFFRPAESREMIETVLVTLFGENMRQ